MDFKFPQPKPGVDLKKYLDKFLTGVPDTPIYVDLV
jgi:hypothetical protein